MADVKTFVKSKKDKLKKKDFVKNHKAKMNKSIDFHNTTTSIDAKDQQLAETTASPELINYLKSSIDNEISKIPFAKGVLTLSQKEPGLYSGFFQDSQGQVIEKFDGQTIELVAKNMEMKQLYERSVPANPTPEITEAEVARVIANAAHDRIDQLEKQPAKDVKSLRVRFGDFELELRKSIKDFVNDFRKSRTVNPSLIKKAIQSWRRKSKSYMDLPNDMAAARELFDNWEEHQEDFSQIVYALQQLEKDNG